MQVFSFFRPAGARRLTFFLAAVLALLVSWFAAPPAAEAQTIPGAMYFTVTPCRLADSRLSAPLASGTVYAVTATGKCGIPSGAAAVALSLIVVKPTNDGYLTLYSGATVPPTSTMNFRAGQIRANNAIVPLDALGAFNVLGAVGGGTFDLVIDTVGYFVGLPQGVDDSYSTPENTPLVVPAPGVLGNDIGTNLQAVAFSGPTTHGTVNLAADGGFTYTPTAGYAGADAFTYTVQNAAGSATASVNLTICPPLSITPASPATPIYQVAYNQPLTGNGGTGPYTFALASGSLPTGLAVVGGAIAGTPTNTGLFNFSLTVTDANGCSTTQAFSVTARPNAQNDVFVSHALGNTQFVVNTAAPATPAVFVNSAAGVLANDNGPGSLSASGAAVGGIGGTVALNANGTFTYTPPVATTGTATFTYTLTDGNGITNTAMATIMVDTPVVWYVDNATASGTNDGRSNTPFKTMTAVGGAATSNGDFIYVAKGLGDTTGAYAMKPSQQLIGAGATLAVGALSVPGNAANTPTLSGTLTLANSVTINGIDMSTGASRAISNFDGATYNTVTGVSLTARTIASTTGTAIDIQGTGNTGTMTFASVSANGGSNGIVLQNFTGGSFTVNGDGADTSLGGNGSGGTIANMSGADNAIAGSGIYLENVTNITIRRMTINGTNQNYGIRGNLVNGFTLEYSTVAGTNGTAATLPLPENAGEGSIYFGNVTTNGLSTSGTFTKCNISGGRARNVSIINTTAGTTTLTIKGNTFGANQNFSDANQSLLVEARNAGTTINSTVGGPNPGEPNTFTAAPGDLVNFTGQTATTMDVVFRNNALSNNHAQNIIGGGGMTLATQGTMTFNVDGNTFRDANGSAITLQKASLGVLMSGTFNNNQIGVSGVTDSGSKTGNGIYCSYAGTGTINLAITNNVIRQYGGNAGIFADNTGGSYTANFTITGNTIGQPGAGAFAGLALTNGSPGSGDTINVCAVITGNDFSQGDPFDANDVIVGASGSAVGHVFNLPGYAGGANLTNVQNFIRNNNLNPGTTAVTAYTDPPVTPAAFTGIGSTCP